MITVRRRAILAAALAGAPLTACTDQGGTSGGESGSGASDGGGSGTPDAGSPAATSTFHLASTEVAVGVRPLVRSGDHLVLTIDLSATGSESDLEEQGLLDGLASSANAGWDDGWGSSGDPRDLLGVRLLDMDGDRVASTAVDEDGKTVGLLQTDEKDDEEGTSDGGGASSDLTVHAAVQAAFADSGKESLAVYVPKLPLFEQIPVIEAEVPTLPEADEELDLTAITEAPLEPMISMSQDLTEKITEQRTTRTTTVSIASDVLFDSSSADLDATAKDALDEAARRITEHEPGPVTVTGHTDSVDSEAFNQKLSTQRAEAVAAALTKRLDGDYELTTEGKGESEPIASNDTADGKARNRRVEITLTTPVREIEQERTKPPEFEGTSAPASEGVQFDGTEHKVLRPFDLQLERARMVDGHLVVTLEVTPTDDVTGGIYGIGQFDTGTVMPEEPDGVSSYTLLASSGAVGVVAGRTITYPALHRAGGPEGTIRPLTDLALNTQADGGIPRILELVYPRDIAGVDAGEDVTLQYGGQSALAFDNEEGWRLTDVPIES